MSNKSGQDQSSALLLKVMFATVTSLAILSVGALILAGVLATPMAPMIIGAGLLAAGIGVSGFFTYKICRDELVSEADVMNQATP